MKALHTTFLAGVLILPVSAFGEASLFPDEPIPRSPDKPSSSAARAMDFGNVDPETLDLGREEILVPEQLTKVTPTPHLSSKRKKAGSSSKRAR